MSAPLVVAGGGIAALVAADAAAAAGRDVALLLPRRGVGGGFVPLVLDGRPLERGLRVLELGYEGVGTPPPLDTYDAGGTGHRPFARDIDAYVRSVVGDEAVVQVPSPQMWLAGRLGDELLLRSDLAVLPPYLEPAVAAAIVREARGEAGLLAAARAAELAATSLVQASLRNHGSTFHELVVAPVLAKLLPTGGDDVPADLRRKLWMAMFHPRTLREAAGGGPISFRPHRPFHDIEPGGPGRLVTLLLERLHACARVTVTPVDGFAEVRPASGGRVLIVPLGAPPVVAEEPILALTPGELFSASGVQYHPDRVHSVLTWLKVGERDLEALRSFVHVVDADVPVFRVSRGAVDADGVTVCVELAHEVPKEDAFAVAALALRRIGLIGEDAPVRSLATFSGPTFTAPTFANRERFSAAGQEFAALGLRTRAIGGSEAFGVDSFNEQVMQGRAAAAWATGAVPLAA